MDTGPEASETGGGKGLGERAELRAERDVRQAGEQAETRPRPRAESYQSGRSASREERMIALEEAVLRISQTLASGGFRSTELRGPLPKARPDYVEYPYDKYPNYRRPSSPYCPPGAASKYPSDYVGTPRGSRQFPKASTYASADPQGGPKASTLSPA